MLIMRGPLALSHFRLERLLAKISDIVPQVNSVRVEYLHLVHLKSPLTKPEDGVLSDLLDYGDYPDVSEEKNPENRSTFFVLPQLNTPSVWSEKALDIIHACHLEKVDRIERGLVYFIESSEKLTWGDEQAIGKLLYDPQKETIFYRLEELESLRFEKIAAVTPLSKTLPSKVKDDHPIEECFFSVDALNFKDVLLTEAAFKVLRFSSVSDKSYLVTIVDRTKTGLVARDQMVGPWQVPVSDCSVLASNFTSHEGEAYAIGERSFLSILNKSACIKMAMGEAITNLASAYISLLSEVQFSVVLGNLLEDEKKIALETALETANDLGIKRESVSDITDTIEGTCVVNAQAKVMDVRATLTPQLDTELSETVLILIDLAMGKKRLGGSVLGAVYNQIGNETEIPTLENPLLLNSFFNVMQQLKSENKILAYHDRSDGGLWATVCEMAFAAHIGVQINISALGDDPKSILFNEELGAVIQVRLEDVESVLAAFASEAITTLSMIGVLDKTDRISIIFNEEVILSDTRIAFQKAWSEPGFKAQSRRDNPRCAKKQFEAIDHPDDPGLGAKLTFSLDEDVSFPFINQGVLPKIAILREEGTYGYLEMSAAFEKAHFECIDVSMRDLEKGHLSLSDFKGLAVCGGFSFGDVLGAGLGFAKRILYDPLLKETFEHFFTRLDTFTLGVSNGCQMLVGLKSIIPGAALWPSLGRNYSEQFEARLCLVEVEQTAAILLDGMVGSCLPVPVAHQEGRAIFRDESHEEEAFKQKTIALRYSDHWGRKTKAYPDNPNGSPMGATGFTTLDGRVLAMMPHPDRAFRTLQYSWHPKDWPENGPWMRLFQNARKWVS